MNRIITVGKHMSKYSSALHTHQNYKLIYCSGGGGRIQFEAEAYPYAQGDLLVIQPEVLHVNIPSRDFNGIYLSVDVLPLKVERLLIIPDTESLALAECLKQIDYFYQQEVFHKDNVLQSYAGLLTNLISALGSMKKISPVIERLKDAILHNFPDASYDLNARFAQEHKYNENYLKKLFKKEVGVSPQQYLINVRLSHAVKLLSEHNQEEPLSVSHISYACGYDDPLYFSRSFKTRYGSSPKAFYQDSRC